VVRAAWVALVVWAVDQVVAMRQIRVWLPQGVNAALQVLAVLQVVLAVWVVVAMLAGQVEVVVHQVLVQALLKVAKAQPKPVRHALAAQPWPVMSRKKKRMRPVCKPLLRRWRARACVRKA
jgi:hypothetical protein